MHSDDIYTATCLSHVNLHKQHITKVMGWLAGWFMHALLPGHGRQGEIAIGAKPGEVSSISIEWIGDDAFNTGSEGIDRLAVCCTTHTHTHTNWFLVARGTGGSGCQRCATLKSTRCSTLYEQAERNGGVKRTRLDRRIATAAARGEATLSYRGARTPW
jgi:hypothetical protein